MGSNRGVLVGVMAAPLLALGFAMAAPITSSTALPVAEGELIVRSQGVLLRSTGDGSGLRRDLTVWAFPTMAVYGATARLALFGILPYLDKEMRVDAPSGRASRGTSGFGDVSVLARYTLGQWDRRGETMRLAPFIGLKMPTGRDDEDDSIGRLPRPLQLGSGSWDPVLGGVLTWQKLEWQLDASGSYRFNTEDDGFRFGDQADLGVSFQYRLWPRRLGGGVPGYVYGVLESNLLWQGRDDSLGIIDPDSGGTTLYLAPGLQYVAKRFVLETAVELPAAQDLNGKALENDYIWTAGFRVGF